MVLKTIKQVYSQHSLRQRPLFSVVNIIHPMNLILLAAKAHIFVSCGEINALRGEISSSRSLFFSRIMAPPSPFY
ncbi:MAG: hypothetical protein NTY46_05510 [Candidatus Sumerlaeota bacterium]|nr:hypothetical protein [Candidatus Sumerlaeota bacterium]